MAYFVDRSGSKVIICELVHSRHRSGEDYAPIESLLTLRRRICWEIAEAQKAVPEIRYKVEVKCRVSAPAQGALHVILRLGVGHSGPVVVDDEVDVDDFECDAGWTIRGVHD